jgi:hypothetical protein
MDRRHDNANHKPVGYGQSVAVYRFGSIIECLNGEPPCVFKESKYAIEAQIQFYYENFAKI